VPKADKSKLIKPLAVLIFIETSFFSSLQARAADWGYDGSTTTKDSTPSVFSGKHPVEPTSTKQVPKGAIKGAEANPFGRSSPAQKSTASPLPQKATMSSQTIAPPGSSKSATASAGKNSNQPDLIDLHSVNKAREAREVAAAKTSAERERKTVSDWLEVYALVAQEHKLSDEQKERFSKELAKCLNGPEKSNFESVLSFWPLVQKSIKNNTEQKENYRSLFKALFRLQLHSGSLSEHESNILTEILGPERIAVPGTPSLTEEACDAYGDMACFMYSQNNPGKTIDAMDNRTIFSSVIQRKFTEAPSIADKLSMANFALKWGKFKVLFADANEAQKEQLADQITGKARGSKKPDVPNPSIESIMTHGPWVAALQNMAKAPKTATADGTTTSAVTDTPQGDTAKAGALTDMAVPHK
jgi:hypothetical protein